jgi:hypothetical protein
MGGVISSPVDESTKQEIQELLKAVLGTFTLQYTKEYALALVYKLKQEAKEKPEEWKLQERPPFTGDFKSGMLTKEGGSRKTWKKRFFVVRPNYTVDYYENEEESKKEKGKKRGTIGLCGYRVNEDPNDGILKRLRTMAEKLGMNPDDIPKGKEYPPFTIELYHTRRRCYYIQAANEEEFKQWVEQFKTCCWRAYGLKNQEFCHKKAFNEAVRKTRWELGRWGWWSYGGTEEQILSDLIVDELEWKIMGRIYSKINNGPWAVRNAIRNQVLKVLDNMVGAAVAPAWKAMEKAVEELRPKIEPTIKEMVDPIGKAEAEVIEKLKNGAMSIINPILQEHVVPHLSKVVEIIKAPMNQAYDLSYQLFDEEISKFEPKGAPADIKKQFGDLDWLARSYRMWPACDKVAVMYDPLWALRTIFEDIYPWRSIWDGYDEIRGRMDNAVYTWEQEFISALEQDEKQDAKALAEKIKAKVLEDYRWDGSKGVLIYYHKILKVILMPPFEKLVIPACKTIIDPVAELIPEPLKTFIDPNAMFEELINGIVDESIMTILNNERSQ